MTEQAEACTCVDTTLAGQPAKMNIGDCPIHTWEAAVSNSRITRAGAEFIADSLNRAAGGTRDE